MSEVETVSLIARERNAKYIGTGRDYVLSRYIRAARRISYGSSCGACKDIAKQAKGIRESGTRTLPYIPLAPTLLSPFITPCPQGLHHDGMHNARWVCRRAVCASYIAMADGRDSEKDFPNRISSPRTAYIFHDRGRANRLPLLSSIFCAPRDISPPAPPDRCGRMGTFRVAWVMDRGNSLENQSGRMSILERYIRNMAILRIADVA